MISMESKKHFFLEADKDRCVATCFCWEPNNQLLIACSSGLLIRYDCETQNVSVVPNQGM